MISEEVVFTHKKRNKEKSNYMLYRRQRKKIPREGLLHMLDVK